MRINRIGRKAAAFFAAGAVAVALGAAVAPAAQAAPVLGTLTITPATGTESTGLQATLSAACPAGSTGIVGYMSGPGISDPTTQPLQGFRDPATSFPITSIFKDVFAAYAIAAPSGAYTVRMACIGADFFTEVGEFSQVVNFTPRAGTNNATYATAVPGTTTTLALPSPQDPVISGTSVTLNASVDGGSAGTPTGSVQFKANGANLGAAQALTSGSAQLVTTAIPAGSISLTATYVPGGANALPASTTTTARNFVVAGPTSITGTAQVGKTITCTAVTGPTKSYSWLKNGVATGTTTASVVVPAGWANQNISCALKTTKNDLFVTRTSAAKKIALGAKLVYTVRPKVLGTTRVGRVLTCSPGTWRPAASSYRYQWFRGTTKLTGKTAKTYRTVRADRTKLITCQVTALRTGYVSGVAKAVARKVT